MENSTGNRLQSIYQEFFLALSSKGYDLIVTEDEFEYRQNLGQEEHTRKVILLTNGKSFMGLEPLVQIVGDDICKKFIDQKE